jgi:hypothetical protein
LNDKRRRREAFFRLHPICCFCGGGTKATEEDHQPPRALFNGRVWPEGYVFPACADCARKTRAAENIACLYAHVSPAEGGPLPPKLIQGIRNNYPHAVPAVMTSAIEKRSTLRHLGWAKPENIATSDIHMAQVPAEVVKTLFPYFAKLYCAIYYKETQKVFPAAGAIWIQFGTSTMFYHDRLADLLSMFDQSRATRRANRDISPQFSYRLSTSIDETLFATAVRLRSGVFLLLMGSTSRTVLPETNPNDWYDIFGCQITGAKLEGDN